MVLMVYAMLAGCVAPPVTDSGMTLNEQGEDSVAAGCEPVDVRSVSFDEDVGGYTAADALGVVLGTHTKTLTWNTGSTTGLTLSLSGATEAVFVDEEVTSTGGPTIEMACVDTLQIAMDIQAVTVDGQLNFETPVVLTSTASEWQDLSVSLDRSDVLFRASDWVSEPHDTLTSSLSATWLDGQLSGSISALGESESGSGSEGVVSASFIEIAVF